MAKTILIVDDDPTQRRLLQAVVEREGFNAALADSGEAAIELVQQPGGAHRPLRRAVGFGGGAVEPLRRQSEAVAAHGVDGDDLELISVAVNGTLLSGRRIEGPTPVAVGAAMRIAQGVVPKPSGIEIEPAQTTGTARFGDTPRSWRRCAPICCE